MLEDTRPLLIFFGATHSGPARRMESLMAYLARKERAIILTQAELALTDALARYVEATRPASRQLLECSSPLELPPPGRRPDIVHIDRSGEACHTADQ